MKKEKTRISAAVEQKLLLGSFLFLFLTGLILSMFLPLELSWLAGLFFILSAVSLGYDIWLMRVSGVGTFDRQLSRGFRSQFLFLLGIVAFIFLLGAGLLLLFRHEYDDSYNCSIDTAYDALLLFAHRYLGYNYYSDGVVTNSFVLLLSLMGTALVGGMLITTLSNIVQQRKEDIERGSVRYKKLSNHVVIIGFGNYAVNLAKNILADRKDARILLMTNKDVARVRTRIRVELPESVMDRLFLVSGEMTCWEDIHEKLNIPSAREVYVMGEAKEFGVDSKSIECVRFISEARGNGRPPLHVYVHLQHLYSNKYIQSADRPSPLNGLDKEVKKNIYFWPFCFYENWGRLLWSYHALPKYAPLYFEPFSEKKHVHLVVVGLNRMGAALVVQAARMCHYPNLTDSTKTVISIIERDSSSVDEFQSMYPGLFTLEDVEIRFERRDDGMGYHSFESFASKLDEYARDESAMLTIAICYRDPDQALSAALRLPESVYYQHGKIDCAEEKKEQYAPVPGGNWMRTQVLIRQEVDQGLGRILDEDPMHYRNFHIFGMFNEGLQLDLLDDSMPMLAKENYNQMSDGSFLKRFHQLMEGSSEYIENYFVRLMENWQYSPEWDRMSNRCQIDLCNTYLQVLHAEGLLHRKPDGSDDWDIDRYVKEGYYRLYKGNDRPEGAPAFDGELAKRISEVEHRRWNAERQIAGWRAPREGEKRLDAFYIHPLIRPFTELDEETQYKDIIVLRAVPLMDAVKRKINNLKMEKKRTMEQKTYTPHPVDLGDIELTPQLEQLREAIAENTHDVWAASRIQEGWTYGPVRDDKLKKHPDLIPYSELPEGEKQYDRDTAMNTIKLVIKLGFDLVKR